jgi:threonine dehydrogenase-like Zn-dependent dehydrogenase
MRAVVWHGKKDVRVEKVPDPKILNPHDCIVAVTSTAICGSDLHLYGGFMPTMRAGDILGHEFMGEVVEVGGAVQKVKVGDRVAVPFCIACGNCFFCKKQLYSCCDNTNPNAPLAEKMYGYTTAGLFGYSHLTGGYAGGQAEYVRVPFADVGPQLLPKDISDDKVLFLTDVFPTGYMAAENCNIEPGQTVAVFGCGPVGLFAIASAKMLGAGKVFAIDNVPERMRLAKEKAGADVCIDDGDDVVAILKDLTGGIGPDAVIDAVGMEAHGITADAIYDTVKQAVRMETDRPHVLRMAIQVCRKGGTVSIPGVYGGLLDKIPFGAAMNKGLTFRTGQTHVQRYTQQLLDRVMSGEIDPSFIITHKVRLEDAPEMYETFRAKKDGCIKVVLRP